MCCRGRYADSFYREKRVQLGARLAGSNHDARDLSFGPVTARFEIGLFATRMHYFMGLPYEPNKTPEWRAGVTFQRRTDGQLPHNYKCRTTTALSRFD